MSDDEKIPYLYLAVRADLPLEKQMIHIGHAASECVPKEHAPISSLTRIAFFHAPDEKALVEHHEKVKAAGFPSVLIHEPDGPEYGRGNVSFGIFVVERRNKLRKLLHHLPMASYGDWVRSG